MNEKLSSSKTGCWAIGMMSGTSLDGVDAALIRTDGMRVLEVGAHLTIPFKPELFALLLDAVHGKGDMMLVEKDLTWAHAEAVRELLKLAGVKASDVTVVGFHGQTVMHRPQEGITWQIGNGALLAALSKIDVVCDFRRRDVAAGGQGAPLVPLYHAALAKQLSLPLVVLNIGGVANLTWVGRSEDPTSLLAHDLLAFDTGPGNALLNDWVHQHTGEKYDKDGALAKAGNVNEAILAAYMEHPYFSVTPPKSLDRNDFTLDLVRGLSLEDGAATLTAFTAHAVAAASRHFPAPPSRWLVTGGGRHNETMMVALADLLPKVEPVENVGWNGDALEAQAFAFLAVRSLLGMPISLPTTTGASHAVTGGALYRAGYYGVN